MFKRLLFSLVTMALIWIGQSLAPEQLWVAGNVGLGLAHIGLGLVYSKNGIDSLWQQGRWAKAAFLLALPLSLWAGLHPFRFEVVTLYFGLHHAIHESQFDRRASAPFKSAVFVVVLASYLLAVAPVAELVNPVAVAAVGLTAWGFALWQIGQVRRSGRTDSPLAKLGWVRNYPWLIMAPLVVLVALILPLSWPSMGYYHYAFYGLLPLFSDHKMPAGARQQFWRQSIWVHGLGMAAMVGLWAIAVSKDVWWLFQTFVLAFIVATNVHISWSFFISGANPEWVRRLVRK